MNYLSLEIRSPKEILEYDDKNAEQIKEYLRKTCFYLF